MVVLQIAAGIVVGMVLLALLPAILGAVTTAVLGVAYLVLEPVAALKWIYNRNRRAVDKAPQAPVTVMTPKEVVERYCARYKAEHGLSGPTAPVEYEAHSNNQGSWR